MFIEVELRSKEKCLINTSMILRVVKLNHKDACIIYLVGDLDGDFTIEVSDYDWVKSCLL